MFLAEGYLFRVRGSLEEEEMAMQTSRAFTLLCFLIATLCASVNPITSHARSRSPELGIPVVMETATVRGKVIVLEDRRTDRQTLEGLKVEVWSSKPGETEDELKKDKLLHETATDEFGMFDLPLLAEADYVLTISELDLRLTVIPKSEERQDQKEAKVLLILLPKEVVIR